MELQSLRSTQMVPESWKGKPNRMDEFHAPKVSTSVCFAWMTSLYYMYTRHGGTHHFCFNQHPNCREVLIHQFLALQERREERRKATWSHSHALHAQRGGVVPSPVQHTYASGALQECCQSYQMSWYQLPE